MQKANIDEYKELRREISMLKNCITTYVGFVFLVVSTAVWQLARAVPTRPDHTMSLVALVTCVGLNIVLFLLLYKFNSHNRYCGYCKLLEQEVFAGGGVEDDDTVFLWETCLDKLRQSDFWKRGLVSEIQSYKGEYPSKDTLLEMAPRYSGVAPSDDEPRYRDGWRLLLGSEHEERGTWQFPLHVVRIFAAIDLGLIALSIVLFVPKDNARSVQHYIASHLHSSLLWLAFFVLLLLLWRSLLAKLYRQMQGSQTVDAFCWKFVAIRNRVLRDLGLASHYKLVGGSPLPQTRCR